MAQGVNCLVLDEPTNHLDLEAIEQLETALDAFDGTLLLVTHDRAFLDAVHVTTTVDLGELRSHAQPGRDEQPAREQRRATSVAPARVDRQALAELDLALEHRLLARPTVRSSTLPSSSIDRGEPGRRDLRRPTGRSRWRASATTRPAGSARSCR